MNTAFPIDIIIPTYGRYQPAHALALSLVPQLSDRDTINIVCQGPSRKQGGADKRIQTLYCMPPNLPRARNRGTAAGTGDIVLFLDDDVVADGALVSGHRGAYTDPAIGAIAGFVDDPLFDRMRPVPSVFIEKTGELFQNFTATESQFTISVMGANMSFRRSALVKAGGFDERFLRNALWEDIDCAFRIRKAGYKIWYCSSARVKHLRATDGGCRTDRALRYVYHQFANTAYFACKHVPPVYFPSWLHYWKYRLEYIARIRGNRHRHDPWIAAAGVTGALAGICRFIGTL